MTKTEMADLQIAIDLLNNLRTEMNHGFERISDGQRAIEERVTTLETSNMEREKAAARSTQRFRWAMGIAVTALVSLFLFVGKELLIPIFST